MTSKRYTIYEKNKEYTFQDIEQVNKYVMSKHDIKQGKMIINLLNKNDEVGFLTNKNKHVVIKLVDIPFMEG